MEMESKMGKRAKPRAETHPDVEIRYNDDGTVDEIIVKSGGVCLFHLEQMSDESYWIGLAPKDGDYPVHIDIYSDKPITARVRI
jgi:predicted  nucleic acid-binding Zn-ribbon protein